MPITPFHFGPGLLIKSVSPGRFSWAMFALSNMAIDLEPISYFLLTGDPAHRHLHSYLGATLLALVCARWGRSLCERALRFWNSRLSPLQSRWLGVVPRIDMPMAVLSALLGTWSHVFLDSIMHADIQPWWPFSAGNGLRGLLSLELLHVLCAALGAWGLLRLLTERWAQIDAEDKASGAYQAASFVTRMARLWGRTLAVVLRTIIGLATALLLISAPLQMLERADMSSAKFDSKVWKAAQGEKYAANTPRTGMLDDLSALLQRQRPDKVAVVELLGRPRGNTESNEYTYWAGRPGLGFGFFYIYLVEFGDDGRVKRAYMVKD